MYGNLVANVTQQGDELAAKSTPSTTVVSELPAPPLRPSGAHKGTFGSALVIAGSETMSGAARLAGCAALHSGAGLVTVAVPRSILSTVALGHPGYMTLPLEEEQGGIAATAISRFEPIPPRHTAVALGPGLGQQPGTQAFVHSFYKECALPVVLDADGLNAYVGKTDMLRSRPTHAARLLTPHPGELSRLLGIPTDDLQAQRQNLAVQFALDHDVVVLLKGPQTIVTDGKRVAINKTGNVALAKGGSGDVLTGIATALLAQGMAPFAAAQLAAHLHGLAGDVMAARHAPAFATAVELLRCLDDAWKQLT